MEYKLFFVAARRRFKKKTNRAEFIRDWKDAQRQSGIKAAAWKK
jgi:hypothetical protein